MAAELAIRRMRAFIKIRRRQIFKFEGVREMVDNMMGANRTIGDFYERHGSNMFSIH
jgi:hypothetical protein